MRHDSDRTAACLLPAFRLEAYFSRWEFAARHVLCASDVEALRADELLALGTPDEREAWTRQPLGYTHPRGSELLRTSIAATYERVAPHEVACTAGAGESIFAAIHAVMDPGDHAIVVIPCYQSLESVPGSLGPTTGIPLDAAHGWALDVDRVRAAIRPTTRLLVTNFPHNPTGALPSHETLEELVSLAREHGIYWLNDEVFRGVERPAARRLPQIADVYERGVSIGGLSKTYGLPGLRVGWVASREPRVLGLVEQYRHYLSLANASPSELLAGIALRARQSIQHRHLALIEHNLDLLQRFFSAHGDRFEWHEPDAATVGFVRYLGTEGVEEFVTQLVERAGVMLAPASLFWSQLGPTPDDRFRIGYGRGGMEEALAALDDHLRGRPAR